MKNITLAIDEGILERVRVYAAQQGTTVNALVRDHLAKLVEEESRMAETRERLKKLIDNSKAELGPGYVWNREEIYAERMFPRHEHRDLRGGGKKG